MLKTFTQLALVGLIIFTAHLQTLAQKNFQKGYVILPTSDTIQGLINDQNWEHNPLKVIFKKTEDSKPQYYTVNQLEGFTIIGGDVYKKRIVMVDKTPTRFEDLLRVSGPVITTDTVFLLEQAKGNINLYYLLDENDKNHFYIQVGKGEVTELIKRNYLSVKNGQHLLGEYDQFREQLLYSYLINCPDIIPDIKKVTYDKDSLIGLINKYNVCQNPNYKVEQKQTAKDNFRFFMVAGLNASNYKFKGYGYYFKDFINADFNWKPGIMAGLAFQIVLPRNRQKWSIYNELALKNSTSQAQNFEKQYYQAQQTKLTIKSNYVGLTTMLRYSWAIPNWQPFVNIGFAGSYALNISTIEQTTFSDNTENGTREDKLFKDFRKYEVAAMAGFGVKVKKITAELRFEQGSGYLNYTSLSVKKNMAALLFGYNFN